VDRYWTGLFALAALFLIAVALHDDIEQTLGAMFVFGLLSLVGTIAFSALDEGTLPTKAALIESTQIGLMFAFGMAVVGLLGLIFSAPIRMISRAIANRNCPTCTMYTSDSINLRCLLVPSASSTTNRITSD